MNNPIFITKHTALLENWKTAFPGARHACGLPDTFDIFSTDPIFVDFTSLTVPEKSSWLACAISTKRKVVVLSPTPSDIEAVQVIKAGAVGYAHSYMVPGKLKQIISVIQGGSLWLGSQLIRKILQAVDRTVPMNDSPSIGNETKMVDDTRVLQSRYKDLSEREAEVCRLVAKGSTNQEIAEGLGIKERTVKAHVTSSFKKLNVRNRVELALLLHNISVKREQSGNSSGKHAL
ncbi:Transcriptional regulatory protein LiaR [Thalassocella blandensis]|nr:Transcriptional regulatory protein LiaR [Thalassocella blandensis]